MSDAVADVRTTITRFVQDQQFPETFLLTGDWGVGKTFLWRSVLGAVSDKRCASRPRYVYCSLFGATSMDEVRERLFSALEGLNGTDSSKDPSHRATARQVISSYAPVADAFRDGNAPDESAATAPKDRKWWEKFSWRRAPALASRIPGLQAYDSLIRAATWALVREAIVCFDDLERRSPDLSLRDLLGLISYLREDRGCKVIVVMNEDVLTGDDRQAVAELREKVFDISVRFDPPVAYAVDVAIPDTEPFREQWIESIDRLRLKNIRVIQRIRGMYSQLVAQMGDVPGEIRRLCIPSMLLLGARVFQPRADLPPEEIILNPFATAAEDGSEEVAKNNLTAWRGFLSDYQWSHADEMDREILSFLKTGVLSATGLDRCVEQYRRQLQDADAKAALDRGWRLFHDSFEQNEAEIISSIYESHMRYAQSLSPMNLDSGVRLLRDLGESQKADELIRRYVDVHAGDKGRFDLESYPFAGDIKDTNLREQFQAAFQRIPVTKDLREVLLRISRDRSWGGSDMEFLASRSVEEFEAFFEGPAGAERNSCMRAVLQFGRFGNATDRDKAIAANATAALERIAAKSRLNALRLAPFGIAPRKDT